MTEILTDVLNIRVTFYFYTPESKFLIILEGPSSRPGTHRRTRRTGVSPGVSQENKIPGRRSGSSIRDDLLPRPETGVIIKS